LCRDQLAIYHDIRLPGRYVLRPEQIGPVPSNAIVVNNAPQLELLKKASMCITHAGFNTLLEALTQGVPQIAIPVTNDQPGVAARITDKDGLRPIRASAIGRSPEILITKPLI
jgi:UDP-glucoronosyl and UDP-glucosyl transferase